ncbi:uncharacterized protein V6R79_020555 [Siganus canaliculatus]
MKPDGVTMETMEPSEAAEVAEPSSLPENILEQAPSQPDEPANDAAPPAVPKVNGKTAQVDPKSKPKVALTKNTKSAGASGSSSQPGTASHRTANDVKSTNSVPAAGVKKTSTTTTTKTSSLGATASKRPVGVATVSSTVKNQSKVPDKKPAGAARSTSAATASTSTRPAAVNGTKKKPGTETVNGARPKMTGMTSRPATSTVPKPSTTSTAKPAAAAAVSRTTRPVTGPSTSRPASTTSRPTKAPPKPSTTTTAAKTTAPRVTTAPSTGRTTSAQPPKAAPAKKDVSRPPSAPVAKKPLVTATASSATRKPEPSKSTATVKVNTASKWSTTTKAADPKVSQAKTQQPAKLTPTKKPVAAVRFPAPNKPPLGRTPPASPANKSVSNTTSQAKRGTKPTQAVSPFTSTKKMGGKSAATPAAEAQAAAAEAQAAAAEETQTASAEETQAASAEEAQAAAAAVAAAVAGAAAAAVIGATETQKEDAVTAPEHVTPSVPAQDTTPEVDQTLATASSPPQSPIRTALAEPSPPQEQPESSVPSPTTEEQMPSSPPVASPHSPPEEPLDLLTDQTPSTSKASPPAAGAATLQLAPPDNLNEEEDEEEREGSQLVSVSEMSGTTQPTEESRPGSAGPFGGSAWRAGGALLSELDSEDVSGSQQGASELSAPGVLEGTESTDDLGDGSLKGAMDMEGASAGSPDFEKVPEIPANDFDEDEDDEDDDNDRVCDMDVGSERADEPQRPRHDNDVEDDDDDEDEDVEMASEGVTESGLESYGNADEDDFVEDERLDNLNRAVQPPPPPPLLPSAPAAQWDQPNPAADPWAELVQPQQLLEQPTNMAGAAAASPLADPWQADSETPTQIPAQAWLEVGSSPFTPEHQEAPHPSSGSEDPKNVEAQMYMIQCSTVPMQVQMQGLAPTPPLSAPGMSLSSTLSSETSTPEELGDYTRDVKVEPQDAQAAVISPQPDPDKSGQETPPADEAAPASNPSSSSVSEDEASDTEGEAQLDDSLEGPLVSNLLSATFDSQPAAQRCLSTVEEGEEAEVEEGGAGEDTTPPSATSLTSYGFDTMTTASNAQSTAESCIKSPGIFSLEELSEEAKEPGLIPQPLSQSCLSEQQYIECVKQETESSADHVREEAPEPEEALEAPSAADTLRQPEENPDDLQPPYYSAICEKTENSFAGNV